MLPRTLETNCPISSAGAPLGASRVSRWGATCSATFITVLGVEAEEVGDDGDHDSADAQPAADADAAPILDVAAGLLVA